MKTHNHNFEFTGQIAEDRYEYTCTFPQCHETIWLLKAPEMITSRSPIGVIDMEEEPSVPEVDPKKAAQRAKQSAYRKMRYQMKKDGTWTGHMPKP